MLADGAARFSPNIPSRMKQALPDLSWAPIFRNFAEKKKVALVESAKTVSWKSCRIERRLDGSRRQRLWTNTAITRSYQLNPKELTPPVIKIVKLPNSTVFTSSPKSRLRAHWTKLSKLLAWQQKIFMTRLCPNTTALRRRYKKARYSNPGSHQASNTKRAEQLEPARSVSSAAWVAKQEGEGDELT